MWNHIIQLQFEYERKNENAIYCDYNIFHKKQTGERSILLCSSPELHKVNFN